MYMDMHVSFRSSIYANISCYIQKYNFYKYILCGNLKKIIRFSHILIYLSVQNVFEHLSSCLVGSSCTFCYYSFRLYLVSYLFRCAQIKANSICKEFAHIVHFLVEVWSQFSVSSFLKLTEATEKLFKYIRSVQI